MEEPFNLKKAFTAEDAEVRRGKPRKTKRINFGLTQKFFDFDVDFPPRPSASSAVKS